MFLPSLSPGPREATAPVFGLAPGAALAQDELQTLGNTPAFNELLAQSAHGQVQRPAPRGRIWEP